MSLPEAFFHKTPAELAQALLGQELTHFLPEGKILSGLIVETEAYLLENDAASHGFRRGHTPATAALFGPPGTLYIHPMRQYVGLDIVALGGSVLLRALQPLQGFAPNTPPALTSGPGKLCKAMAITKNLYGHNLLNPACPLKLLPRPITHLPVITRRVGITQNKEAPLRFCIPHHPSLSR